MRVNIVVRFFCDLSFDVEYFLDENDIEEEDDVIVPYFSSTCMRRDRVPSVPTFYEEVLTDFSSFGLIFSHLKELFSECFCPFFLKSNIKQHATRHVEIFN